MRIGLQIPSFSWPGNPGSLAPTLAEIGRTADDAGFASLWVMDHFFQIPLVGAAEMEAQGHFTNHIYRGYKADIFEGGHRVPFLVRWPGKVAPGSTSTREADSSRSPNRTTSPPDDTPTVSLSPGARRADSGRTSSPISSGSSSRGGMAPPAIQLARIA